MYFIERKNKLILLVLVSAVVLSGTLYSFSLGNNLRYMDERVYYNLGTNIITSHQYSLDGKEPTVYKPPGYPLILSLFILLGANIVHLRILNFVALGLCMYLLHKILKKQSSPFAATVGALLVICYPVLFYTAGILYPQTIGSFLFLLIIFFLTRKTKSYRIFLLSGLLFGCLILTIPSFVFLLFVFALWLFFSERSIKRVKEILIMITVAFLLISIWPARNYAVFNSFVFPTSHTGLNLLLGNSENTSPSGDWRADISKYTEEAHHRQLNQIETDAFYKTKAIEWISEHKLKALKLYLLKFLNYFHYRNELATKSEASLAKDILMFVTYGPLLLLFVSRILFMKRFRISAFVALLIIAYISSGFFHAIFITRIRYRLPFDFLLIGVAAMFVQDILHIWLGGNAIENE